MAPLLASPSPRSVTGAAAPAVRLGGPRNARAAAPQPLRTLRVLCGEARAAEPAQLKSELKRLVASTKRGKQTSPQQRQDILTAIQAMEAVNPTEDPTESELLSGNWALLYNGAGTVDDEEWKKSSGEVEGPFLSFFKPLTKDIVVTKGDSQLFDVSGGNVENKAEFRVMGKWDGYLNIRGTCSKVPPEETDGRSVRLAAEFTDFVLKLGGWQTEVSLSWVRPQGWVQTTYLDEDFRIGRGDKGSVFVTARKTQPAEE